MFTAYGPLEALDDAPLPSDVMLDLHISRKAHAKLDQSVPPIWGLPPGSVAPQGLDGTGTLVCIIDSGVDVTHPDFQPAPGRTRVVGYWAQDTVGGPGTKVPPSGMNAAAVWTYCTQGTNCRDPGYHGTHVGSTAAGKHGVASNADILVVQTNFFTSGILDGVNWCVSQAVAAGKPVVINLSLGYQCCLCSAAPLCTLAEPVHVCRTSDGPRDGSHLLAVGCDEALTVLNQAGARAQVPGRAIVVAAGNEGADQVTVALHAAALRLVALTADGGSPGTRTPPIRRAASTASLPCCALRCNFQREGSRGVLGRRNRFLQRLFCLPTPGAIEVSDDVQCARQQCHVCLC